MLNMTDYRHLEEYFRRMRASLDTDHSDEEQRAGFARLAGETYGRMSPEAQKVVEFTHGQ